MNLPKFFQGGRYGLKACAIASISILPQAGLFAFTGGDGSISDPYIMENTDNVLDDSYVYELRTSIAFASDTLFYVGKDDAGNRLNIRGGLAANLDDSYAYVGYSKGSYGYVFMESGATWRNDFSLAIGYAGQGAVSVNSFCLLSADYLSIGKELTGDGLMYASGTHAEVDAHEYMYIGDQGSGMMSVYEQAKLYVPNILYIGYFGGTGELTAHDSGTTVEAGTICIGDQGTGTMTASSGVLVDVSDGVVLGRSTGGSGTLLVKDYGTQMTVANNLYIGDDGKGSFQILDGARVTNANSFLGASEMDPGGSGTAIVDGENTSWLMGSLCVGSPLNDLNYSKGALYIANMATVSCDFSCLLAQYDDCNGLISIRGSGSLLTIGGDVRIGDYENATGTGTIRVNASSLLAVGGTVTTANDSVVRLAGGNIALKGQYTAAQVIAAFSLQIYDGADWTAAKASDLTVNYIDGSTSVWSSNDLYSIYGARIDLTGYTLIKGGKELLAWADYTKESDDWYQSAWYGWVSWKQGGSGWVYHVNHGWQYVYDLGNDAGIVLWDVGSDCWWFTSKDYYPYLYNLNTQSWYYYYVGGVTPNRWFYDYKDNQAVKESVEFAH